MNSRATRATPSRAEASFEAPRKRHRPGIPHKTSLRVEDDTSLRCCITATQWEGETSSAWSTKQASDVDAATTTKNPGDFPTGGQEPMSEKTRETRERNRRTRIATQQNQNSLPIACAACRRPTLPFVRQPGHIAACMHWGRACVAAHDCQDHLETGACAHLPVHRFHHHSDVMTFDSGFCEENGRIGTRRNGCRGGCDLTSLSGSPVTAPREIQHARVEDNVAMTARCRSRSGGACASFCGLEPSASIRTCKGCNNSGPVRCPPPSSPLHTLAKIGRRVHEMMHDCRFRVLRSSK
ncbi:hypothetical protein B0J12DRAFT_223739 [Macrophomina phaseolina]|uniref:Uncharacterized protein n=1 Tax=Macrophomina phaseolina TaxID=35725 RepID=A0ABQ8G3L9_9PEZI|nr:hypothetical protein B0J12DRAFT_223739 [Macrophomina phaseolina]